MTNYSNESTVDSSPEHFPVHDDFDQRIVIKPKDDSWTSLSIPGIEHITLDRIGGHLNCATTLVRYTQDCEIPENSHTGGLEIFVLDGMFSDEHGEYSTGAYVRIPNSTCSTRRVATKGSLLFMKFYPLSKNDKQRTVIDTKKATWRPGVVEGLQVMPLHEFGGEHVALVRWAPHTQFNLHSHRGGEEILVLKGVFHDEYDQYPTGTWIRSPHLSRHTPFTKEEGALIYVKVGHLVSPDL